MERPYFTIKNSLAIKFCFKNDHNCQGNIIRAHSIQNKKILDKLAVDDKVLIIDSDSNRLISCNRNNSTIFKGFCSNHDVKIFSPIEIKDYNIENAQQNFLFAYRALAKEYYEKVLMKEAFEQFVNAVEKKDIRKASKYMPEVIHQDMEDNKNREFISSMVTEMKDLKIRFDKHRRYMNEYLEKEKYNKIKSEVIVFDKEYGIAISSMIDIAKDLKGKVVNDIHNRFATISPLFITMFPQKGKTYAIMSYFSEDKEKFKFIKNQILSKTPDEQKVVLSNIIAEYIENVVVSPSLWDNVPQKQKDKFYQLYDLFGANVYPLKLVTDKEFNIFF